MSIKKFCPWSNCNETININQRYCDKHQAQYEAMKAERTKKYDNTIRLGRDKKYHSFYVSKEWETIKTFINRKYKGLCLYSYFMNHAIVQADAVHHIVEIKDDWNKRLDIHNLIPLSNEVHGKIGKLYKDKDKKQDTQLLLRELIDRWDREMKGQGDIKKFGLILPYRRCLYSPAETPFTTILYKRGEALNAK